jgi:Animal haem peroxidase
MRNRLAAIVAALSIGAVIAAIAADRARAEDELAVITACVETFTSGLPLIAAERTGRFQGKIDEAHALCRGGDTAVRQMSTPWVDWSNYWATGDASSKSARRDSGSFITDRNMRGVNGALIDLEYQRMELIRFNLFDNKTFRTYLLGEANGRDGATVKIWPEMRLPPDDPAFHDLQVDADGNQQCTAKLIRFRTIAGICNDERNPAMGASGQLFGRNVEFESTFPDLEPNEYAKNRHGGRISLFRPDPQVISRKLFTRDQSAMPDCKQGRGTPGGNGDCAYNKAPFFNVLAAFWIQFMTHDWFSHLEEARNDQSHVMSSVGCTSERVDGVERPITPERATQLGCRPDDKMEAALIADASAPPTFEYQGRTRLERAYKTTRNTVTAWWDASQLYGYDERSRRRVRRDPADAAKLMMLPVRGAADRLGYLPEFAPACAAEAAATPCDPIQPEWVGQEATAFPDNWSIGMSFFHNLFVREHNLIVDAFRDRARAQPDPDADSGLRDPSNPSQPIPYGAVSNDELFEIARLIVAAEIAKIHTIEWTTQLLYDEPLYVAMNSNWSGLFGDDGGASRITRSILAALSQSPRAREANQLYAAFAAGSGIVGSRDTNHFGAPFNFPEEFISVYRLHPLVPDMIEFRDIGEPDVIRRRIPVIDTFRDKATTQMRAGGLANWALSMGRQRLGALTLQNHPQFLQNLDLRPRLDTEIDVAALDIIRDRERGIPRFNEFRRQIGLRQLTSFDDFIDRRLLEGSPELEAQRKLIATLREVYGQHTCDASKIITTAQRQPNGKKINDCLGHDDGTVVDNIEDVDLVVGYLAEMTRPHGFAISETQFHIFILNASRRLFSDRFFTSDFRPAFYTQFGIDWVMNNGPTVQWEDGAPNGHRQEMLPLKRILLRAVPELAPELRHVVNSFDPWARDRGEYYSLDWKPRADAVSDPAFR